MSSDESLENATVTATPGLSVATAVAHGPDLPRGTALGRYVIVDRIGSGGMSVVYSALDP